jgi:dihydrofolate synthase/folylpolyglutamate synthase
VSGAPALGAEALLAPRLEQRILPGLDRMRRALATLGHPETAFPSVLVLGTNGKGSTSALLAAVLQAHGLTAGLYTSPHLVAVEERIRVGGATIARDRMAELVATLARFPDLSYFETLTCAALLEFAERKVDLAVMEAGLGGRWDASAAAPPVVALLSNVGTDHMRWLGPTRAAIAAEKAAALSGREAIVGAWDDEVEAVIRASAAPGTPISLASDWAKVTPSKRRSEELRVKSEELKDEDQHRVLELSTLNSEISTASRAFGHNCVTFKVGVTGGEVRLPLAGEHQLANLALALAGAAALAKHGLGPALEAAAVRRGIEGVSWPGRLQWCRASGRELLVDGAHNREAMTALAGALDAMGLSGKIHLLFSCLDDKPLEAMAALLRPRVTGVTVVEIASSRATPAATLAAAFPGCRRVASAAAALLELPADRPTLVTGSLRLAGEVLVAIGGDHA